MKIEPKLFGICRSVSHQTLIHHIIDYRDLDIIEETDRKGRRVFCAKFDRYPKWGGRHNITAPKSIPAAEPPTGADDGYVQIDPRFQFEDDEEYSNEEDDINFDSYEPIDDNYWCNFNAEVHARVPAEIPNITSTIAKNN